MLPSIYPLFDPRTGTLADGASIPACSFCKKALRTKQDCTQYYASLAAKPEGFYQCPFGFTSRTFHFAGQMWVITGVIAHPRFAGSKADAERAMAKQFPANKVARDDIDRMRQVFTGVDSLRADTVQKAAQIFPQAFHELRKLNAAVLQHAEKELQSGDPTGRLQSILSAAELMRNNFDILEALSNIDTMRAVPLDSTINVYDLLYKTRCIYIERASARKIQLSVDGVRAIVKGSRKSFPIVPAVLMENAIKYGKPQTSVRGNVAANGKQMILSVENETAHLIDPATCFNRGSRFAGDKVEGGGFGLFLAREIVLAHKGQIRCEVSGSSVRMLVELPLHTVIQ